MSYNIQEDRMPLY